MSSTVVGLLEGGVFLEDIRISVPHRVAVNIPPHLVLASQDLRAAINNKQVFQLSGVLPQGSTFRGLPSRAQAPVAAPVQIEDNSKAELAKLTAELAAEKARSTALQSTNETLQSTLTAMSGQLTAIQDVLEILQKQGITVSGHVPQTRPVSTVKDDIPMFIPDVKREDAKVNIKIDGESSGTDLATSKSALKKLREKSTK